MMTDEYEYLTRIEVVCRECGSQLLDTEGKLGTWSITMLDGRLKRHYRESGHTNVEMNVEMRESLDVIDMELTVGEINGDDLWRE